MSTNQLRGTEVDGEASRNQCEAKLWDPMQCWMSWVWSVRIPFLFNWVPSSAVMLARVEAQILRYMRSQYETFYVTLPDNSSEQARKLWTVKVSSPAEEAESRTPLVLVHGMAGGIALWIMNFDQLASRRHVYAFDMLGFGRSSRPPFSGSSIVAEMQWVESFEEWRQEMGLEKVMLLGHSLGGYLSAAYALQHPERVEHLFLVDPWGFTPKPSEAELRHRLPSWARAIGKVLSPFNPLAALRVAGPWGPGLVEKFRPDVLKKYAEAVPPQLIADYIYHSNVQKPTGEAGFKAMSHSLGWSARPMLPRLSALASHIPVTFLYGSRTWMDPAAGFELRALRGANTHVHVLDGCGHHVYADAPEEFNTLVVAVEESMPGQERSSQVEAILEEEEIIGSGGI